MSRRNSTKSTRLRAHKLRHNLTEAEARLWTYLRAHRLRNTHFRRQHVIGKYIVDFCAPRVKLIIELDGSQHLNSMIIDRNRSEFLASKGYHILRFWNNDVSNSLEDEIRAIEMKIIELENQK